MAYQCVLNGWGSKMWKFRLLLALIVFVWLGRTTYNVISIDLPPELAVIDADLALFQEEMEGLQIGYVISNGVFYQILTTHSTVPIAGDPVAWNNLLTHPTDVPLMALEFFDYVPVKDYLVFVDVYEADMGQGYTISIQTDVSGEIWQRSINIGSETWREKPWFVLSS